MLAKLPLLVFTGLVCLQSARSETTTVTMFPGDPGSIDNLHGEIDGTGADGTTYIISGLVSATAFTATIVEDSTHVSEIIAVKTEGASGEVRQDCALPEGTCTAIVEVAYNGFTTATTVVAEATLSLLPVALEANSASGLTRAAALFVAVPLISLGLVLW